MPFPAVTFLTPVKVNKTACRETYINVVILVIEASLSYVLDFP